MRPGIVRRRREGSNVTVSGAAPHSFPRPHDAVDGNAERIAAHVLERARPGSIILLHVMFRSRAESRRAVPAIVHGLRARGYRFVTVSELMAAGPAE